MAKYPTPVQNSYADFKVANLLRELDKYLNDKESGTDAIDRKDKKKVYERFTNLLLNLNDHKDNWDNFKKVVDGAIAIMQKDTASLNTIVYNDLRKSGLQTREEKESAPKKEPSYAAFYREAFEYLTSEKGNSGPFSAADILNALSKQSNKTGRATTIKQVQTQFKKLAKLGLAPGELAEEKRIANPFKKSAKKKTAAAN